MSALGGLIVVGSVVGLCLVFPWLWWLVAALLGVWLIARS
jgi:hypothetical protein